MKDNTSCLTGYSLTYRANGKGLKWIFHLSPLYYIVECGRSLSITTDLLQPKLTILRAERRRSAMILRIIGFHRDRPAPKCHQHQKVSPTSQNCHQF